MVQFHGGGRTRHDTQTIRWRPRSLSNMIVHPDSRIGLSYSAKQALGGKTIMLSERRERRRRRWRPRGERQRGRRVRPEHRKWQSMRASQQRHRHRERAKGRARAHLQSQSPGLSRHRVSQQRRQGSCGGAATKQLQVAAGEAGLPRRPRPAGRCCGGRHSCRSRADGLEASEASKRSEI